MPATRFPKSLTGSGRVVNEGVLERLVQGACLLAKQYPGKALRALRERGISDETISVRCLGYTSRVEEWLEVSRVTLAEAQQIPGWPEKYGVWNDRIVGPWRRFDGTTTALWGRALGAGPKYLVCGQRPILYGHDRWSPAPKVVNIIEGILNVCELETAGVANVGALGGNAFTFDVQDALIRAGVQKVRLALDADRGGAEGLELLQRQHRDIAGKLDIEIIHTKPGNRRGNPAAGDFGDETPLVARVDR
jgi:DNA primase